MDIIWKCLRDAHADWNCSYSVNYSGEHAPEEWVFSIIRKKQDRILFNLWF